MDGEAAQLRVRRIEAGRRTVADATNGGDSARPSSKRAVDGDGRGGRDEAGSFEVVREVKSGAQTRWPTRGSGADEHSRRYGRRTHRVEHSTGTGEAQ